MNWRVALTLACLSGACAGGPAGVETDCHFVRREGLCEATVTLSPRENDSPDEATMLEIGWRWKGQRLGEVPDRVVRRHLTARDARSLAQAVDEIKHSRCVVEQAIEPEGCIGIQRIVWVEADP